MNQILNPTQTNDKPQKYSDKMVFRSMASISNNSTSNNLRGRKYIVLKTIVKLKYLELYMNNFIAYN